MISFITIYFDLHAEFGLLKPLAGAGAATGADSSPSSWESWAAGLGLAVGFSATIIKKKLIEFNLNNKLHPV